MSESQTRIARLSHRLLVAILLPLFAPATAIPAQSRPAEQDRSTAGKIDPVGQWQSVDFVRNVEDFQPGKKQWKGDLFLKEFQFFKGGKTSLDWTWKQDWITHSNQRTRAQYYIRNIDGATYLFLPWLSGDVTERGQKPIYYVLKKTSSQTPTSRPFVHTRTSSRNRLQTVRPISSVKEFDDVRWKDMSGLDLAQRTGLPASLIFNQNTVWPVAAKMPAGCDPKKLMSDAQNPGLGIRELHSQGITGKGVNVAIIDQPLYQDHPEFAGKIAAYHDVGCNSQGSMHGPAVASLLVGNQCGTAPDARIYYVAAPSWTADTAYQAKALDWIIEQNSKLPEGRKIRAVSVSAAPSGPGSPFKKNQELWDPACSRAEAAGLLVLDCTEHHGFIGPCYYDAADPENVDKCRPGFPGLPGYISTDRLLVPCSPRTTAEEYNPGECAYQYYGRGGLSWSIPYGTGLLALGWQLRPELPPEQMRTLLIQSAHLTKDGAHIVNPKEFIRMVKATRPAQGPTK
jgi:serine protease AprX